MSNGLSAHAAYEYLDKKYQHDTSEYYEPCLNGDYIKNENGLYIESPYNDTNKDDNIIRYRKGNCNAELFNVVHDDEENSYVCITHPKTDSYEDKNDNILLKGSIKINNPNVNEYGFAVYAKGDANAKPIKPLLKNSNGTNENFKYDNTTHTFIF